MTRNLRRSLFLPFLVGCTATPQPKVAPPTPVTEVASPTEEVTPEEITTTEPATAEATRDPERALQLVEEGRTIQRERAEGGAMDAIAAYEQALEKDPICAAAYWELGWSYQVLDQLDDAVRVWDRLRELDPKYPELDVHHPVLLMRRDQQKALAALPDTGTLPPPEEEPREGPSITFNAVGDVHMGRAWPASRAKLPPNDAVDLLAGVTDHLKDADITFGNLETVLADDGPSTKCGPRSTKCFSFRVPTSFAKALRDSGFDVMSIANNHSGDFGPEGRETTMKALDAIGIKHSGPIGDIASWETNGLRMGLVAFSTGGGVYRLQEIATAKKVVADLDRTHDLVIVSFHGGAEGAAASRVPKKPEVFYGESRGDVYAFAHAMIDVGADLVLGHGPHRLRAMEIYKGRFIAYSLGNFSTWKTFSLRGALGISTVLKLKLAANGVVTEATMVPVVIRDPGRPQPDPKGRAIEIVRDLSKKDFGSSLFDARGSWARRKKLSGRNGNQSIATRENH